MESIIVDKYTVNIFLSGLERPCPIIFTHMDAERASELIKLCMNTNFALAAIDGADWNKELSPWPAPAAFRAGEAFDGDADTHIQMLTSKLIPAVYSRLDFVPSYNAIMGYSLDGLFALYALYKTDIFKQAASISGSLWYDGFTDFIMANKPLRMPESLYFSLGDKESSTKNARLAAVYNSTLKVERHFAAKGIKTVFELNAGGHFVNVPERIAKAIFFTLQQ